MPKGKFWPAVRARIWEKAEQLFMQEQVRTMDCGITPERCELLDGGYFERAKILVLRQQRLEV
jgi:hypothetical protein